MQICMGHLCLCKATFIEKTYPFFGVFVFDLNQLIIKIKIKSILSVLNFFKIKSNQKKKITIGLVTVDLVQFFQFIRFESNDFFADVPISIDTNTKYMNNIQKKTNVSSVKQLSNPITPTNA